MPLAISSIRTAITISTNWLSRCVKYRFSHLGNCTLRYCFNRITVLLIKSEQENENEILVTIFRTSILAFSSWKGFQFFLISSIFPLADFLKDNFKKENKEVSYSKLFWIRYAAIWILFASIPILNIVYTTVDEEPLKALKDTILEREDTQNRFAYIRDIMLVVILNFTI